MSRDLEDVQRFGAYASENVDDLASGRINFGGLPDWFFGDGEPEQGHLLFVITLLGLTTCREGVPKRVLIEASQAFNAGILYEGMRREGWITIEHMGYSLQEIVTASGRGLRAVRQLDKRMHKFSVTEYGKTVIGQALS